MSHGSSKSQWNQELKLLIKVLTAPSHISSETTNVVQTLIHDFITQLGGYPYRSVA
jgi:hypothetical protein